ncbi:rhombosortase [Gayadomonas joobiniege]|uniref:rhombosortase n=1 Tax=Gayadomonas joobiniege TaxID=1234606 RepID=UPI0003617DFE|nr:rhombosortase [Gayadomonas joobiniege]
MSLIRQIFKNLPYLSLPIVLMYVSTFAVLLFIPDTAKTWLRLDIQAMLDEQIWRAITGHFLHTNFQHMLLNAGALIALWALHGQFYHTRTFFSFTMLACCFISACLYLFDNTQIYVGFSGVLHALVIWGAILDIRHQEKTGYLLLMGAAAKVIWEQMFGPSPDTEQLIQAEVAVNAHLAGAVFGFLYAGLEAKKSSTENLKNKP